MTVNLSDNTAIHCLRPGVKIDIPTLIHMTMQCQLDSVLTVLLEQSLCKGLAEQHVSYLAR